MTQAYLVTDRKFNADLLEKLLPKELTNGIQFFIESNSAAGATRSSAILARKQRPTALVLDAYTTNEQMVDEQHGLLFPLLRRAAVYVPCEIFFALPTTEIVFFQDQALLEYLLQRKFTDIEWHVAQFSPREVLLKVLEDSASSLTIEGLFDQLTDDMVKILRKHPFIQQLITFFSPAEHI